MSKAAENAFEFQRQSDSARVFHHHADLHSGRNEYIRREEAEQVGNLQGVFRDYFGIKVKMNSPLATDWVHNTKKGRS